MPSTDCVTVMSIPMNLSLKSLSSRCFRNAMSRMITKKSFSFTENGRDESVFTTGFPP